jgi:hypothetical protein
MTGVAAIENDDAEDADDAEVEAAIEQEPPAPPAEDGGPEDGEPEESHADDPVDAPDGDPVDAPDTSGDGDDGAEAAAGDEGGEEPTGEDETGGAADDDVGDTDDGAGPTLEIEVPANLQRVWEHQAKQAKLSVSEYVVRMTEAGRMSVQMQPAGGGDAAAMSVEQLTEEVVEQLRHEEAVAWEELLDAISKNLEEQLEEALERLQEDGVVRYSGLQGGYRLVEEDS